jgi:solute carrier family 34 (sodium-dependent phosphate cotransporter)
MSNDLEQDIEQAVEAAAEETGAQPEAGRRGYGRMVLAGLIKLLIVLVGLSVFILALRFLSKGAGGIGPFLTQELAIDSPSKTLGFGWLFAYIVLSGSPVASIALSFFDGGTISATQTFTMITGSRLGASFIVLFIGFIYYLRGRHRAASISMGVIALTVTATTYLPALALGYWMLDSEVLHAVRLGLPSEISSVIETVFDPIARTARDELGPWLTFVLGVGTLLVAFNILDRALPQVDAQHSAFGRVGGLIYKPWAMFALGAGITSLTLSVSVSLSILVPLSARGFIRRENTLPYIMGANITTFIDTLVAALLLNKPVAFTIVLVEMLSVTIISVIILLFFYRSYERAILGLLDRIVESNRALALFMVAMVLAPIALLII